MEGISRPQNEGMGCSLSKLPASFLPLTKMNSKYIVFICSFKIGDEIMKTSYEWFKEKAGLTNEEAFEFFDFKFKQLNMLEEPVDMDFIERISKEARKWKKNLY
jgi:hypothetical protein